MKKNIKTILCWSIIRKNYYNNLDLLFIKDKRKFMKRAKRKYYDILKPIQKFKKNDVLELNLLNATTLAAIYLSCKDKSSFENVSLFYKNSMVESKWMRIFYEFSKYYNKRYQNKYKKISNKSKLSKNPYSWKIEYVSNEDINSFSLNIFQCGICKLFKDLNIYEIVPVLCNFDFTMAKYTNTIFTRKNTLASGGSICDCNYKKSMK